MKMGQATGIEWTDATWNPVVGCTKVSAGCKNCYAKTLHDMRHVAHREGKAVPEQYAHPFEVVQLMEDRLAQPLSWRKPKRVFVNSVSDLFHEDIPDAFLDRVFAVMAMAKKHVFQVLTKRSDRMQEYMAGQYRAGAIQDACRTALDRMDYGVGYAMPWPLPNVWLGVSVEDQKAGDNRIPDLLNTPASIRFLSCEPLIGPVDLTSIVTGDWAYGHVDVMSGYLGGAEPDEMYDFDRDPGGWIRNTPDKWERGELGVDWVIVGGESGASSRPCELKWIRSIVKGCADSGVPCFVKQLGSKPTLDRLPLYHEPGVMPPTSITLTNGPIELHLIDRKGGDMTEWPADLRIREFPEPTPCKST